MAQAPIIGSEPVLKALLEKGLIPPHCMRVVIDLNLGELAKVYFQCCAEKPLVMDLVAGMGASGGDGVTEVDLD